jgi:hypothetical protein
MNINEIIKASQKIKDYPESHGYEEDEVKKIKEIEKSMTEHLVKMSQTFDVIKEITEKLRLSIETGLESIAEFNKRLPELSYFSEFGWYIGFNVFDELKMVDLFDLIKTGDSQKVDEFFLNWFDSNKKSVFSYFVNQYPNRRSQFYELEMGFKHQLYSSVIILSYSITDGITNEILGFGFFDPDKKNKFQGEFNLKIKGSIDEQQGLLNSISSQFLKKRYELTRYYNLSEDVIPKNSYNRHLVIHGHSFEYGNKINAVRALLLLDFTISLLERLKKKSIN